MKKVNEYRQRAEACRIRARAMPEEEACALFISLAEGWEQLATDRDDLLARQRLAGAFEVPRLQS